jgi:hypothetical protein
MATRWLRIGETLHNLRWVKSIECGSEQAKLVIANTGRFGLYASSLDETIKACKKANPVEYRQIREFVDTRPFK